MADAPVAGALVVPPPRLELEDAAGVADGQGTDPPVNGPGNDRFDGLVLGLADAPPVTCLS